MVVPKFEKKFVVYLHEMETKNLGETGNDSEIDLRGEISIEINTSRTVTISFDTHPTLQNDNRTMALSFLHYMTKSLPL